MTLEREGISSDRTFSIERSIALYNFFSGKGDRSFCIQRSIALYYFFTGDGRSLFLYRAGRSPFTTFLRAAGDRSFCIVPVDRPLRLFYGRRAIALFVIKCDTVEELSNPCPHQR